MDNLPLSALRFGHEHPELSIDARSVGRDDDLAPLAASLLFHGQLKPVLVWKDGDWFVPAGNRRLAAFHKLRDAGDIRPDHPVYVRDLGPISAAEALEISVADNIQAPLHPVDEFRAFAKLAAVGFSDVAIARAFAIDPGEVRKRMALGKIAPVILEAWAAGEIMEKVAQTFTVCPDLERQASVFEANVRGQSYPQPAAIRLALIGTAQPMVKELEFVGAEAYTAAGGELVVDLFEEHPFPLHPDILLALVREKLREVGAQIAASEGWGWVRLASDVEGYWNWPLIAPIVTDGEQAVLDALDELKAPDRWSAETQERREAISNASIERAYTPEAKAQAGIFVRLNHDGVAVVRGFIEPAKARDGEEPTVAESAAPTPSDPMALPGRVLDLLRDVQTHALRDALAQDHEAAQIVLLATLWSRGAGSPLRIKTFGEVFLPLGDGLVRAAALSRAERDAALALALAREVDARTPAQQNGGGGDTSTALVAGAVNPALVVAAMRQKFDPIAYFGSAKAVHAIEAIRDMDGDAAADGAAKGKKSAAAARAAALAPERGWLPPMLRVDGYELHEVGRPVPDEQPAAAPPPTKFTRTQRACLVVLRDGSAVDRSTAMGPRSNATLNPQTLGALQSGGWVDKAVMGARGESKETRYWLTETGKAAALSLKAG